MVSEGGDVADTSSRNYYYGNEPHNEDTCEICYRRSLREQGYSDEEIEALCREKFEHLHWVIGLIFVMIVFFPMVIGFILELISAIMRALIMAILG